MEEIVVSVYETKKFTASHCHLLDMLSVGYVGLFFFLMKDYLCFKVASEKEL